MRQQQHSNAILELRAIKRKQDYILIRKSKSLRLDSDRALNCDQEMARLEKRIKVVRYYLLPNCQPS